LTAYRERTVFSFSSQDLEDGWWMWVAIYAAEASIGNEPRVVYHTHPLTNVKLKTTKAGGHFDDECAFEIVLAGTFFADCLANEPRGISRDMSRRRGAGRRCTASAVWLAAAGAAEGHKSQPAEDDADARTHARKTEDCSPWFLVYVLSFTYPPVHEG
jgi:hypothetical protein